MNDEIPVTNQVSRHVHQVSRDAYHVNGEIPWQTGQGGIFRVSRDAYHMSRDMDHVKGEIPWQLDKAEFF